MNDLEPATPAARRAGAGLPARREAVRLLVAVLEHGRPFDQALRQPGIPHTLPARDRSLTRAIAATALRRKGQIDDVLARFLRKPLPKASDRTYAILLAGAAQLLFMRVKPHAAIDLAVRLAGEGRGSRHYRDLVNAVLRRVAAEGGAIVAGQDAARLATPEWLWSRWTARYGAAAARAIAEAHLEDPPLDLTVKADPAEWSARLGGILLPTGTLRLPGHAGRIEEIDGFAEGAWWVQDTAAALPARLLGDVRGRRILDLCAAPGGKTAQLAVAGARVTAVDASEERLAQVRENLDRLGLDAEIVVADAAGYLPAEPADAILLDAPCTSTGIIRRHPDILHRKSAAQLAELAGLQARLLDNAGHLVKPGGFLVYCVCSLEAEEGPQRIEAFLEAGSGFARVPITPEEIAGLRHLLDPQGDLRTLPYHEIGPSRGIDGFYAARLRRS